MTGRHLYVRYKRENVLQLRLYYGVFNFRPRKKYTFLLTVEKNTRVDRYIGKCFYFYLSFYKGYIEKVVLTLTVLV